MRRCQEGRIGQQRYPYVYRKLWPGVLLALVSLVSEGDGSALLRVGGMDEHALSRRERAQLAAYAREQGEAFPAALNLAAKAGLSPQALDGIARLRSALAIVGWQASPWQFLARYLFGHGDLVRRFLREGSAVSTHRLLAIGQLLAVARAFASRPLIGTANTASSLRAFLTYVRRLTASSEGNVRMPPSGDNLDAVRILTVHASKGLEFPVVYVTNLADKRFPFREMWDAAPPPPGLVDGGSGGRLVEEARLFFVAISRAKKELVLSCAARYGKSNYSPSPLLSLVEPFFASTPLAWLHWENTREPISPSQSFGEPVLRVLQIGEVEDYMRCPRRYEYRYGFGLVERDEDLAYKRFQICVNRVVTTLRADQQSGVLHDQQSAQMLLAEEWARNGPHGHPYEDLYRGLAESLIMKCLAGLGQSSAAPLWRDGLDIDLGEAKVYIRIDRSTIDADGLVRLRRLRTGRERDEDHKAPRLALLRKAAGEMVGDQAKVAIELEYLADGRVEQIKYSARWEQPRIDALVRAVAGIVAGRYPAAPENRRLCTTCPYWVVCPA